jgi:Flp pilus assembly protein TadG
MINDTKISFSRANRSRRAPRRGSVMVMMALSVVALLGATALAVDYGLLVTDANRLQRACDAAALAGAQQLKTSNDVTDEYNAKLTAQQVASQNGVSVNWAQIEVTNNYTRIQVTANTTRSFFFAPVLGQRSGVVRRRATAGVSAGDNLSTGPERIRVAPIGITWETYNAYNTDRDDSHDIELVRQNKQTFGLDDMVLFDLRNTNAKSGAHMQDQLTGDEVEYSSLGDYETTLNAAQASEKKKLKDGLDTLFERSEAAPWNDAGSGSSGTKYSQILAGTSPRDNPRVVYLIVTPSTSNPKNGTFDTQVQGFAPVYIESYYDATVGSGKNAETVTRMRIRFLPPASAGDGGVTVNPGGTLSGVRVISLLD